MKIIAKVLDVEDATIKQNHVCKVVLKSGADVLQVTLWGNEVSKGKHELARKLQGQHIITEVSAELYNGQLRYGFGYDPQFTPVSAFAAEQLGAPSAKPRPKAVSTS